METVFRNQTFRKVVFLMFLLIFPVKIIYAAASDHCQYDISENADQTVTFKIPFHATIAKTVVDIDFTPDRPGVTFGINSPCGSVDPLGDVQNISCTTGSKRIFRIPNPSGVTADYRIRILHRDGSLSSDETWTLTIHGLPTAVAVVTTVILDIESLDASDNAVTSPPSVVPNFDPCPAPTVDLAAEYDFGDNKKNTPATVTGSFTLGNTASASSGGADLVITGTSDPPGGRFDWSGSAPSFSIRIPPGGSSFTFNVQFDTNASPGLKTDDVTFTFGSVTPSIPNETITLKGKITVPQIRVTYNDNTSAPATGTTIFTFPDTVVGESSTPAPPKSSLKIWNDGDADLVVSSISAGTPFSITSPTPSTPFTVSPGSSQPLAIAFDPPISSALGPVIPQSLTIDSDDQDPHWLLSGTVFKLRIIVCLDVSGSMTFNSDGSLQFGSCPEIQSRLYLAKQRLKPFFDMLRLNFTNRGDVGLLIFPDPAILWSTDCSTATTPSAADIANINMSHINNIKVPHLSAISSGGLVASGDTPLAEGLEQSIIKLTSGSAYNKRFLYLVTDGAHHCDSSPPFDGTRSKPTDYYLPAGSSYLEGNEITVYTIGMGASTTTVEYDRSELQQIASNTGGKHYDVDLFTHTALINALKSELQTSLNLAALSDPVDSIDANQSKTHRVNVTEYDSPLTFLLAWEHLREDLLDFELVTPSGEIITPGVALEHPDMEYISGIAYKIYFIGENYLKDPATIGEWKLIIKSGNLIRDLAEIYTYSVLSKSGLQLGARFDKSAYFTGSTLHLEAGLVENGIPILGADVKAEVTMPLNTINNWLCANILPEDQVKEFPRVVNGEHLTRGYQKVTALRELLGEKFQLKTDTLILNLYDDGTHGDKNPSDGIYTNRFTKTTVPGSYSFSIDAVGTTSSGATFTRNVVLNQYIDVDFDPDSSAIEFVSIDTVDGLTHEKVVLLPKDKFGNCLGLDREDEIGFSTTEGTFLSDTTIGDPNGGYFRILEFDPDTQNPIVEVDFQGEKITKPFPPPPGLGLWVEPFVGWFKFSDELPFEANLVYGGRIGYTLLKERFEVEAEAGITATDDVTGDNGTILQAGASVLYNILREDTFYVQPFIAAGAGFLNFSDFYDSDSVFTVNYGVGAKYRITKNRFLIRADARDFVVFSNVFTSEKTHNLRTTVGLVIRFSF